jgi:hypothetical protein
MIPRTHPINVRVWPSSWGRFYSGDRCSHGLAGGPFWFETTSGDTAAVGHTIRRRARPAVYDKREKTLQSIADMFDILRSTVYGHLDKTKNVPRQPKKVTVMKS